MSDAPSRERIWQQTEIPATCRGPVFAKEPHGRKRDLEQFAERCIRKARRVGHAVVIVRDRINTRAIQISRLLDTRRRPTVGCTDGKARRTVALGFAAADVFKNDLRQLYVGEKRVRRLTGGPLVRISVARQFMAFGDDATDDFRIPLSDPSQREKSGLDAVLIEHCEDALDVALDATGNVRPVSARDVRRKCTDLEIILDVDRQGVDDARVASLRRSRHVLSTSAGMTTEKPVTKVTNETLRCMTVPVFRHPAALAATGQIFIDGT